MRKTLMLTVMIGGFHAWNPPLSAQTRLQMSGYAVSFPSYQETEESIARLLGEEPTRFFTTNRVRLRPSLDFEDGTFIRLEWEVGAVYSSRGSMLRPNLDIPGQVVRLSWNPVQGNRWSVVHAIDRLFLRTTTGAVEWTVGRQRIAWGSGRVWNPTDLFNPLNPAVIVKTEKDGVDALVGKLILGNFTDATVVWNPRKDLPSNYGIRIRTNAEGFDFAGIAGRFDRYWSVGADVTGAVLDAGVRCEMLWLRTDRKLSQSLRAIVGIDNQFTERFYAVAEYHFNGVGASDRFRYDIAALARGEIVNVGREFGTIQTSYLLHPLLAANGMLLTSFTDGSGGLGFGLSYNASEETTIALGGQYFFGDPLTEYRFYPRTVYGRVEVYF